MTRETAEAWVTLLKGIGFAMFFCIGLGGTLISNSAIMIMPSLVVVSVCWIVARALEAYAEKWEDENFYEKPKVPPTPSL